MLGRLVIDDLQMFWEGSGRGLLRDMQWPLLERTVDIHEGLSLPIPKEAFI
jgi:hypothetical protein